MPAADMRTLDLNLYIIFLGQGCAGALGYCGEDPHQGSPAGVEGEGRPASRSEGSEEGTAVDVVLVVVVVGGWKKVQQALPALVVVVAVGQEKV